MQNTTSVSDVLIIGASAAGLSAAIFAARRGLKTVVVSKDLGGQLSSTVEISNYPGVPSTEGFALAEVMHAQAIAAGASLMTDAIVSLTTSQDATGSPIFTAVGQQGECSARSLILAVGKTPRDLGLANEVELLGRGVGYCAPSQIKSTQDQTVVIVGGGSTAFAAARLGSPVAEKIYLVHRSATFRAEAVEVEAVKALPNVEIITDAEVTAITGTDKLTSVTVTIHNSPKKQIACDKLFIGIGFTINPQLFSHLVETNKMGQITVNERQATSCDGIFAAGDVTDIPYNQAVISAGEGAKAALSAYTYLTGRPAGADWGTN